MTHLKTRYILNLSFDSCVESVKCHCGRIKNSFDADSGDNNVISPFGSNKKKT